jgi:hypothetical protein
MVHALGAINAATGNPRMSLLDGCDEVVDRHLSINDTWRGKPPRFKSKSSLNRVQPGNLPNGRQFIADLYGRMVQKWEGAGCPQYRSRENWRFEKRLQFQDVERGPEVPLERTIAALMDDKQCANQIPVDSGLGSRARYLDLALRDGTAFEFIELKVASDTPLSAAIQVLLYGLTNVFFQAHSRQLETENLRTPLLQATEIHLRVLAPRPFYDEFNLSRSWLSAFEERLGQGVRDFSQSVLAELDVQLADFRFDAFPGSFDWDQTRHADEQHRMELLTAFQDRSGYLS